MCWPEFLFFFCFLAFDLAVQGLAVALAGFPSFNRTLSRVVYLLRRRVHGLGLDSVTPCPKIAQLESPSHL